jgi:hypothetical protein
MELNKFCFNHHHNRSLRLTSPLSLSPPRTHFLGCNHTLLNQPPATSASSSTSSLRFRNKRNNKLGLLRLHSPRFVFKASLASHSLIVVVVVVTLSAVSFLHFTLNNKKKKNLNQVNSLFLMVFLNCIIILIFCIVSMLLFCYIYNSGYENFKFVFGSSHGPAAFIHLDIRLFLDSLRVCLDKQLICNKS